MVYSRGSATIPLKSEVWGTVSYVSPESLQDTEFLDVRSDVFSFCVALFEATHGARPFTLHELDSTLPALPRPQPGRHPPRRDLQPRRPRRRPRCSAP